MTTEEFVRRAKSILGDGCDFTKTKFLDYHIKTIITCREHGDWLVMPANVLYYSSGCPLCKKRKFRASKTLTSTEFIRKAWKIHRNEYDYSRVRYVSSSEKVCIICRQHGEFRQTPNNHLKGQGCPICGRLKRAHKPHADKAADLEHELVGAVNQDGVSGLQDNTVD